MRKKAFSCVVFVFVAALFSGCAMLKPAADAALSLGGAAKPEYKGTLEQIRKAIGTQEAKAAAPEGYAYRVEYRYKGALIEASDLTWEEAYYRIGSAGKSTPPTATSGTATAASTAADARLRAEIEAILKAAGVAEEK